MTGQYHPQNPMEKNGFTLIEMMVALFLFALLAGSAMLVMRQGVDSQAASKNALDNMAGIERMHAIMAQDFSSAQPVLGKDDLGNIRAAFIMDGRDGNVEFTGFSPLMPDAAEGVSPIYRVHYELKDGDWSRRNITDGEGQILLDGLDKVEISVADQTGQWIDIWMNDDPRILPMAIAFSFHFKASNGQRPLVMKYLLPAGEMMPSGLGAAQ